MNVHTKPQLTPSEQALFDAFSKYGPGLPGGSETSESRRAAIELLKIAGLPSRRVEAWHYTDLRRLLTNVPSYNPEKSAPRLKPLLEGSSVFSVVNGKSTSCDEIEGITSRRLGESLSNGDNSDLSGDLAIDDTIGQINRAFVSDGWKLRLADHAALDRPIEFQALHGGGHAHSHYEFTAGAGSKAVVVERLCGSGNALATNTSKVDVGAKAELTWIILQEQPEGATGLSRFVARLAENAKLRLFIMNAGGKLIRHEIKVKAEGEGADFQLRGVNLLSGETHTDVTMVLDHLAYATTSEEIIRNVVTGKARGVFQGQIKVDREAQKTDARMACNTLLLSDEGEFSAKPELEIYADDVACGHGATVTEINADHLFYLMARGVPEHEARGLLVKAFLAEIIEELEDETLIEALERRLDEWFSEHG